MNKKNKEKYINLKKNAILACVIYTPASIFGIYSINADISLVFVLGYLVSLLLAFLLNSNLYDS